MDSDRVHMDSRRAPPDALQALLNSKRAPRSALCAPLSPFQIQRGLLRVSMDLFRIQRDLFRGRTGPLGAHMDLFRVHMDLFKGRVGPRRVHLGALCFGLGRNEIDEAAGRRPARLFRSNLPPFRPYILLWDSPRPLRGSGVPASYKEPP